MSKLAALAAAVALVLFPVLAHAETSIVDSNGVEEVRVIDFPDPR